MNEYKVWDVNLKKMFKLVGMEAPPLGDGTIYFLQDENDYCIKSYPANQNLIFMQYTGLVDKQEIKIFKYDIVCYLTPEQKMIVCFGEYLDYNENVVEGKHYGWHLKGLEDKNNISRLGSYAAKGCLLIGSIYE